MSRTEDIRERWEFCTRSPTGPEHQPVSDIKYLLSRVERLEAVVAAVKEGEEHIQDWDSQDGACNPFWEAWDKACRMAKAVDALEESDGQD